MTFLDPNYKGDRIAKVIARCGCCSRREAEELIKSGQVKVNGKITTDPSIIITDQSIKINDKLLNQKERTRLWLFHKPKGCIVSNVSEKHIPTIFDLLPRKMPRVIAAGRLDVNTEGLLLLTNNGELSNYITNPKTAFSRKYRVRVFGKLNKERFKAIEKYGLTINKIKYKPIKIKIESESESANSWLSVVITEGKNREIKNIMKELGLEVTRLIRVSFGPFKLGKIAKNELVEVPFKDLKELFQDKVKLE